MKTKVAFLCILTALVILFAAYEGTRVAVAAPVSGGGAGTVGSGLKIGVVSIRGVFSTSKRIVDYRQVVTAEQMRVENDVERLSKEIEADKAGLRTLVRGSADYMKQLEELAGKEAQLATKKEFYGQSMAMQQQSITEELYQAILEQSAVVAKQKGLDLVLEKSEPEIPAQNGTQLELAMGTHKVLYSGGCVDITAEVTAGVDAQGAKK